MLLLKPKYIKILKVVAQILTLTIIMAKKSFEICLKYVQLFCYSNKVEESILILIYFILLKKIWITTDPGQTFFL